MVDVNKQASLDEANAFSLLKSYLIGFLLTVGLVVFSYLVAKHDFFTGSALFFVLAISVVLQLIVQISAFLRLNDERSDNRWSSISFLFTLLIIAIIVIGNLWILYNLNLNMMM